MLFISIGGLLSLIGIIWLVVLSIQTGKTTGEKVMWAIVNIIGCQPIGGIVFFFVKRVGLVPLLLVIIGVILQGIGLPAYYAEVQRTMQNMPH